MSIANPFQIPSCLKADLQRRRQVRFQRIVTAMIVAGAGLMVVLLIVGCINQQSQAASSVQVNAVPEQLGSIATVAPALTEKPLPLKSTVSPAAAVIASVRSTVSIPKPVAPPAELVYVVKRGDTLSLIARLHGTSIQSLKEVNGLGSDKIVVGAKLKLPSA